MCDHQFPFVSIIAPKKHAATCIRCGYKLIKIGTHQCQWVRGIICDDEGNEMFQITGTEAWVCTQSGEVLQNFLAGTDPNELGLKCHATQKLFVEESEQNTAPEKI